LLHAETSRLARLVADLGKVSRAEERQLDLRLVRSDPHELLREAAAAATTSYAQKRVAIDVDPGERLPAVEVDRDRIAEVLANLLSNALRHSASGDTVVLAASRAGKDAVQLSVTDNGEGIPADALPRIFERFYRTDTARSRDRGGSGIGLTIARAIVEAHGGTLRAESDGVGRGARFVCAFPRGRS
jgi:signal transduction histidine kinase